MTFACSLISCRSARLQTQIFRTAFQLSPARFNTAMKGISVTEFGGPEKLVVAKNLVKPTVGDSDVLINIKSHGVNPVDTYIRAGVYPTLPKLPYTPGKDGAGLVEQVGRNVKKFKVGDRVYCTQSGPQGTLAEYVSVTESSVFHLSQKLSFDEGSALPIPFFTAYRALFITSRITFTNKTSVFIHGASGSVGQACIQLAKAKGARVCGTASTSIGLSAIKALGADAAYDHSADGYVEQIKNQEEGFDVIIEMLANQNLQKDIELLNRNGIVVVVGCRGEITINPRSLMAAEKRIAGCSMVSSTHEELQMMGEVLFEAMEQGKVKPTVSKVYSLSECGKAHHDVINQKGLNGKLVVRIDS